MAINKAYANINISLSGKVVVVDIGHGGVDPGTTYKNIYEKDINLKISLFLEEELIKKGATVILTRDGDYDLSSPKATWRKKSDFDNRIKLINKSNADIYVSIHLNYLGDKKYSGGQVFFNTKDARNEYIAEVIQDAFNTELKSNRDIKKIPSDLYMYKQLKVPGVLVECGFLSNTAERKKLTTAEFQKQIAKVIVLGLEKYF